MSYKKAKHVLPKELLEQIQQYVEGEYIYIPKRPERKKAWGSATAARQYFEKRNRQIYIDCLKGEDLHHLSEKYFLSLKSIQRIIRQKNSKNHS